MKPQDVNIEQIERFISKDMKAEESAAFKQEMEQDAHLKSEVSAYQTFFEGAQVLQTVHFQKNMNEWSADWSSADKEESLLIEMYLNDELHRDIKKDIEKRINENPTFAKKIGDYKKLQSGFNTLADDSFLQKMKNWEETAKTNKINRKKDNNSSAVTVTTAKVYPLFKRLAIAASFLLVVSVGMKWYASENYAAAGIAQEYYKMPQLGNTQGAGAEAITPWEKGYIEAHRLFGEQRFDEADALFGRRLIALPTSKLTKEEITRLTDEVKWYQALSILKTEKNTGRAKAILQDLRDTASGKYYKNQAVELLAKLNSFWFKIS